MDPSEFQIMNSPKRPGSRLNSPAKKFKSTQKSDEMPTPNTPVRESTIGQNLNKQPSG